MQNSGYSWKVDFMSKVEKLCKWKKEKYKTDFDVLTKAVKKPKYVCEKCGRAAKKKKYICEPKDLP